MLRDEYRHPWRERVRSLWFLPAVFVVGALGAGYVLSRIEVDRGSWIAPLLFHGDATSARELLTVVAGTMITVTGLVFVLTVVALQIASTQFSPRLLRSFLQDAGTRLVLGVFVATFSYSLGGLFTVGQNTNGSEFVPQLAVTGSLGLALVSVGMLIYYIQHITDSIRIDTVMHRVRRAATQAVRRHHPYDAGAVAARTSPPPPPEGARAVPVGRSGYIQEVDVDALGRWAIERRLTVVFRLPKGRHMVAGSTLAFVWGETGVDPGEITDVVNRGVVIAVERRVDDDPGFGIRQLVDIALKAVAPSMNDPYTAVQAIQHLSVVLSELARVATQDIAVVEDGVVRVHVPVPDFAVHMETVCSNVRLTAAHRPRIMLALLRLLEVVGSATTSDERRQVIARHVELVVSDSERLIENAYDLEPLHAAARDVERALGRS